ncbi:hypothetical protein D3C85_1753220 [compost metagenome]
MIYNDTIMVSKTIEKLKYLLLEYGFYFSSITLLSPLMIYNHSKTLVLEKELVRINKELYVNQVSFKIRQKAYDTKMK